MTTSSVDYGSMTFPDISGLRKLKPEMNLLWESFGEFALGKSVFRR